jgi:hypothetical protein
MMEQNFFQGSPTSLLGLKLLLFLTENFSVALAPDIMTMDNFPQKFFFVYFIRFDKRNNFVEEIFSIRALFRRENSI